MIKCTSADPSGFRRPPAEDALVGGAEPEAGGGGEATTRGRVRCTETDHTWLLEWRENVMLMGVSSGPRIREDI